MTRRLMPAIAVAAATIAVVLAVVAALRKPDAAAAAPGSQSRAAWETAWRAAHGCLFGATPLSADPEEAVIVADLTDPDRTCGRELVALGRAAADTESELQTAIGDVADAFAIHQRRRLWVTGATPDPFPAAAAALEKVAAAAHPEVTPVRAVAPSLPALSANRVLLDGERATLLSVWRGHLYATRSTNSQRFEVRWERGAPAPLPFPEDGSDAAWSPKAQWQVWVETTGDKATLIAANDQAEAQVVIASGTGMFRIHAIVGEGANRLVIYSDNRRTWLARTTDGAAHWARVKLPIESWRLTAAVGPTGDRVEVVWLSTAGIEALTLSSDQHATGAVPAASTISPADAWSDCSDGALWLSAAEGEEFVLRRPGIPAPIARFKADPLIQACSIDKAAVLVDSLQYACDFRSCVPLPTLTFPTDLAIVGGAIVRVAAHDDVVGVWWDADKPVFARLPGGRRLDGVVDTGALGGTGAAILTRDELVEYVVLPR